MFIPDLSKVTSPTMRRILASGRQPFFNKRTYDDAKQFFQKNPEANSVLCFADGRLIEENEYLRRTRHSNRYIASIVAISMDGIPVRMGRAAVDLYTWQETL